MPDVKVNLSTQAQQILNGVATIHNVPSEVWLSKYCEESLANVFALTDVGVGGLNFMTTDMCVVRGRDGGAADRAAAVQEEQPAEKPKEEKKKPSALNKKAKESKQEKTIAKEPIPDLNDAELEKFFDGADDLESDNSLDEGELGEADI